MKIYTLENKNEILAILTHNDNMSYRDFKNICLEASEGTENDFYSLKDILINDYNFQIVEACGGYEVSKKRGAF
jgi:hypothetical protein